MNERQYKFQSSIGPLYLVSSENGLSGIFWGEKNIPFTKQTKNFDQTISELKEYFEGNRKIFTIPLDIQGTEFQKRVWNELQKIPFGQTISYKELAERISSSKFSRAVGTANGKNPLCIIIPCHRVIASNGTLGGYAGGLQMKRTLLDLES